MCSLMLVDAHLPLFLFSSASLLLSVILLRLCGAVGDAPRSVLSPMLVAALLLTLLASQCDSFLRLACGAG